MGERSVYDLLSLAIVTLITGSVLLGLNEVRISLSDLQSAQLRADVAQIRIQQEDVNNSYNNTNVNPQDVVSLILKEKNDTEVVVYPKKGSLLGMMSWSRNSSHTKYTASAITAVLDINSTYYSEVIRDYNNEVQGYRFTANN